MSAPADSLIADLDAFGTFAAQHKGEWLDNDAMRPAEELDARIEILCQGLGIAAPPRRSPPGGMGICYFGFTQAPFWWECHPRITYLDETCPPAPDEGKPLKRMFEPDDEWRAAVRRLLALAKVAAGGSEGAAVRPKPRKRPGRKSLSVTQVREYEDLIASWERFRDGKHGSCDQATLVWKERTDGRFGKFSLSSSGCESRPAKAEPSRSAASLAVGVATSRLMRSQAKR